jgi:hypothetical protein
MEYKTLESKIKESALQVDEAPLVMNDMDMIDTFFSKIKDDVLKAKRKNQHERNWPILQQLAKMAGYGVTKKGQNKDKSFRYDLKKK